jgi:hypothetical protein
MPIILATLGGYDQEDRWLEASLNKKFSNPISTNSWAQWYMPVIPSYVGS